MILLKSATVGKRVIIYLYISCNLNKLPELFLIYPIFTLVLIKLCPSSSLFYFWLFPPTSCLPLPTTPFVEIGMWGFQRRHRVDTSRTCQVDRRQSRAVHCSLHSLSFCLSHSVPLSVSLTLSPLSFCLQDLVSLQPASQPDSYVGEPD